MSLINTPDVKLTDQTLSVKNWTGEYVNLYRIEATQDFSVLGFRILKGDIGGWVESSESVENGSWVEKDSMIFDGAVISNGSIVRGTSRVHSSAIKRRSTIKDSTVVGSDIESSRVTESTVYESVVLNSTLYPFVDITNSAIKLSTIHEYTNVDMSNISKTSVRVPFITLANIEKPQHVFTLGPIGSEDATVNLYRTNEENGSDHNLVVGCWTGTIDELMDEVKSRRHVYWSTYNDLTESDMDKLEQQYATLVPLLQAMKDSW